jgi:hypothetical protein
MVIAREHKLSLLAFYGQGYATHTLNIFIDKQEAAMDEYLFLLLAKLKSDRAQLQRQQRATVYADASSNETTDSFGSSFGARTPVRTTTSLEDAVMKRTLAFGLSLLINAAVFGVAQWNVNATAAQAPPGKVYITELGAHGFADSHVRLASGA